LLSNFRELSDIKVGYVHGLLLRHGCLVAVERLVKFKAFEMRGEWRDRFGIVTYGIVTVKFLLSLTKTAARALVVELARGHVRNPLKGTESSGYRCVIILIFVAAIF
jgi:hypothetical protein